MCGPPTLEESGLSSLYEAGAVTFPETGDSTGRRYLRTLANYNNINFIAEVTITVMSGFGGDGIAFFGLGAGICGCWLLLRATRPAHDLCSHLGGRLL